ncbi:hypothetical protein BC829DRAFT_443326 [Chytridium lagenaria]|nr:hypothetical protein BC829DRAFT_443326 [Chytridium lagenaria]
MPSPSFGQEAGQSTLTTTTAPTDDVEFDIIFMDIVMPELDGITTTQEIRRLEKERRVRERQILSSTSTASSRPASIDPFHIVGVSSLGNRDTIRSALDAGMNGFILKPWKREHIHMACGRDYERHTVFEEV